MSGSAERLGAAERRELVRSCLEARRLRSRPVISGYSVGAALLGGDGRLYCAGNIECWGQTPSICAERTALFKALSELCTDFAALAVCGGPADREPEDFCTPCGVCRQVLLQFCPPDMPVLCVKRPQEVREYTLAQLLPDYWTRPGTSQQGEHP